MHAWCCCWRTTSARSTCCAKPLPQPRRPGIENDRSRANRPPEPRETRRPMSHTVDADRMRTVAANGDAEAQSGIAAHLYLANRSMERRAFVDADGELLIVPQQGRLVITTELGVLDVKPGEIALVPRGLLFKVALPDG